MFTPVLFFLLPHPIPDILSLHGHCWSTFLLCGHSPFQVISIAAVCVSICTRVCFWGIVSSSQLSRFNCSFTERETQMFFFFLVQTHSKSFVLFFTCIWHVRRHQSQIWRSVTIIAWFHPKYRFVSVLFLFELTWVYSLTVNDLKCCLEVPWDKLQIQLATFSLSLIHVEERPNQCLSPWWSWEPRIRKTKSW